MLSKEKIEEQSYEYAEIEYNQHGEYDDRNDLARAYEAGAIWSSEQYAGVVKSIEEVLNCFYWDQDNSVGQNKAIEELQTELNKLKQL